MFSSRPINERTKIFKDKLPQKLPTLAKWGRQFDWVKICSKVTRHHMKIIIMFWDSVIDCHHSKKLNIMLQQINCICLVVFPKIWRFEIETKFSFITKYVYFSLNQPDRFQIYKTTLAKIKEEYQTIGDFILHSKFKIPLVWLLFFIFFIERNDWVRSFWIKVETSVKDQKEKKRVRSLCQEDREKIVFELNDFPYAKEEGVYQVMKEV